MVLGLIYSISYESIYSKVPFGNPLDNRKRNLQLYCRDTVVKDRAQWFRCEMLSLSKGPLHKELELLTSALKKP